MKPRKPVSVSRISIHPSLAEETTRVRVPRANVPITGVSVEGPRRRLTRLATTNRMSVAPLLSGGVACAGRRARTSCGASRVPTGAAGAGVVNVTGVIETPGRAGASSAPPFVAATALGCGSGTGSCGTWRAAGACARRPSCSCSVGCGARFVPSGASAITPTITMPSTKAMRIIPIPLKNARQRRLPLIAGFIGGGVAKLRGKIPVSAQIWHPGRMFPCPDRRPWLSGAT